MIRRAEEAVGVGRQIYSSDQGTLVRDHIKETGILVSEAVVVLTPNGRRDQQIQGGDGSTPFYFGFALFQPLCVLIEHGIDNVDERFIRRKESVAPG